MGLLDFLGGSKKSSKEPATPLEAVELIERHLDENETDKALSSVGIAVAAYPRSEAVLETYRIVKKRTEKLDIQDLRDKIKNQPHPVTYAQLADLYREIGDLDIAIDYCRDGIKLFPDHEGTTLILAKIRLERFREDYIPFDGIQALRLLQQAKDLNRNSYKTLMMLAELYLEIGAREHSIQTLEDVLYFAPEDDKATSLLRQAQNMERLKREDLEEMLKEYSLEQRTSVKRRRNRQGTFFRSVMDSYIQSPLALKAKLGIFTGIPGFQAAVAMNASFEIVASHYLDPALESKVTNGLQQIFEALLDCSYRMDIGGFKRGLIEGPSGFMLLFAFETVYFTVVFSADAKQEQIEEVTTRFLEHELYVPPEV